VGNKTDAASVMFKLRVVESVITGITVSVGMRHERLLPERLYFVF
jgi:hypothetical protein